MRAAAKSSLYFFAKGVLGFDRLRPHLHLPACNYLQLLPWNCPWPQSRMKALIMPRDHYKSTMNSVAAPIWVTIQDPNATSRIVSAVEDNSVGWLYAIRQIFKTNEKFRWLFPELLPDASQRDSATAFTVRRPSDASPETQPTFRAASIISGQASKHVNYVFLDDLVNEMTVDSPRLVERAVTLYKLTESIMKDWTESALWLAGTPWGFGDVLEYALQNEVADGTMMLWKIGCYGAFETSAEIVGDPRFAYTGTPGDAILPDRHPREDLKRLEKKYGPFQFSSNYLCNPFDDSQSGFRSSALRYFRRRIDGLLACDCHPDHAHHLRDLVWGLSLDPAFSDADTAAESAICVGGMAGDGCRYLFHVWSGREDPSALWTRIQDLVHLFRPWLKRIGVEAVASQKLFAFWFKFMQEREDALPGVRFIELVPDSHIQKEMRIRAEELPLANGQWHISYGMDNFMGQFTKFPRVRPIDILDAWAYLRDVWEGAGMDVASEVPPGVGWNQMQAEIGRSRIPYAHRRS